MSDYLDQIEKQLSELTEQGAHRRLRVRRGVAGPNGFGGPGHPGPPRRRSEALAVLAAVAVAAAVVAIVVLNVGSGTPRRTSAPAASAVSATTPTATTTTPPATTSATTPTLTPALPLSFAPQSFTAISELRWWVLGSGRCPGAGQHVSCTSILETTDGGLTFKAVQPPSALLTSSDTGSAGYSQIRFADATDGYAYGPDLYATHDGGTTWAPVDVAGRVADLAISAGEAYAIVTGAAGTSGRLMRSPVGQDQWAVVPAAGEVSGGLWVQGANVLVQSGSDGPGTKLLVSHDGGATFLAYPAPSPGLPCQFEGAATPDVWAHCATGTESGVWLSHDGGASFAPTPPRSEPGLRLPNSAVFGAASGTTAVVGYQQLFRTGDAGQTWTPVGPSGIAYWTYIAFSDPTHGVALGYVGQVAPANERLYYTTDAGQTYHLVALP